MVIETRVKPNTIYGNDTEAFGANPSDLETIYKFRYKVVDLDDLIPSHQDNLQPNPEYPAELQPRLRDRAASKAQIDNMANNLNPRVLLNDSGFLDTGPMIVGDDNVVESGNGRTLALRKVMLDNPPRYQLYKNMLKSQSGKYGLNDADIDKIRYPVLVRERITKVDRTKFTAEANISNVMAMSPFEQALQDGKRLSDNIIKTMEVSEDQTVDQALRAKANSHIVNHFLTTIPANERASISDSHGEINSNGYTRLKNAIFAKTYTGDSGQRLLRTFSESADPHIKNVENGMFQSLPDMAKAESLVDTGSRDKDLSIAGDLAQAIDTFSILKQRGIIVQDYLKQSHLFDSELTPLQNQILEHLDDIGRSPKKVREFLKESADRIVNAPSKGQSSMLGESYDITKEALINNVINKQRAEIGKSPVTTASATSKRLEKSDTGRITGSERMGSEIQKERIEIKQSVSKPPVLTESKIIDKGDTQMASETRRLDELTEDELIEELARRKKAKEALDKPANNDIMTSEGSKKDGSNVSQSDIRTADREPANGHGVSVRERQQPEGIQSPDENERTGPVLPAKGEGHEERSRESDSGRDVRPASLESGRADSDVRTDKRLEPLTPGQLSTSKPKDVILDSNSDIGFNAGAAARFDANLAAIRTLKALDKEERQATPEEQAVLARYSGFGDSAFNQAFDPPYHDDGSVWTRRGKELKELTTEDEYHAITRSRINAFYTTPEVINTMWNALKHMGVDNLSHPRILEPSAGSGRFLGYQPKELAARSERTAVELDQMTGRILKQLYPESEIYAGVGYQEAPIRKGSVDIAISNVPFGNVPVFDKDFRRDRRKLTRSIHNYFFAKSLDHLRPGGVLAFITSHNTLDAPTARPIREYLADQADFVGALRLPKGAFPDTEVVTDIVFMRKRQPNETPGDKSWIETGTFKGKVQSKYGYSYDQEAQISQYFLDHPEMVLGNNAFTGTQYRGESYSVEPEPGVSLSSKLNQAVNKLPINIIQESKMELPPRFTDLPTAVNVRENARVIGEDGSIYIKRGGTLENADFNTGDIERVKGMLSIRDAAKSVLDKQLKERDDSELKEAQGLLNREYDKYVALYGPLSAPANADLMKDDPDGPFLKAMERNEVLKKDKKRLTESDIALIKILQGKVPATSDDIKKLKTDFFSKRTIHGYGEKPVTTDIDAESVVKNETGRLDFRRMAALLGKDEEEIKKSLSAKKLIYLNPIGDWEPADEYLTGDVREKLRIAQKAADALPQYKPNVEALKAVQPKDIEPGQISVKMGVPWVPAEDINEFIRHLLHTSRGTFFEYNKVTNEWVRNNRMDGDISAMNSTYGTERMPADKIIDSLLNSKIVEVRDKVEEDKPPVRNDKETISAQEKARAIERAFQDWIWSDPERAKRLAEKYNDTFNNFRPRVFDGSHLALAGMSEAWNSKIHPHVKDAIWRVVQDRKALLAHEVGFGKTAVMVGSGMELRRLGLAQKVLYVVPKPTHAQFRDQFLDMYPYANVLFPEEGDFTDAKRREFTSRAATGDWDAVILSYEQFSRLPVKPETQAKFLNEEIATIREALEEERAAGSDDDDSRYYSRRKKKESKTQKELEKALQRAEERLAETMARIGDKSDNTIYFEDIGVDQLFVDEADNFKNLRFTTRMGRVKGLPNSDSQRAWDMYQKTRDMQSKGKGVVFATGTPISNTIAEMYTMMRYLQEPMLEAKGMKHFDAWARTFGETTESIEQTPTGKYKLTQRFSKFQNTPELNGLWQQTTDIRVADEVPEMMKQRPRLVDENGKAKRTVIPCPPDQALLNYMESLGARAQALSGKPEKGGDNMLKISNDARKASLDMRMVNPYAPENPNNKIAIASQKIADIYKETTPDKGTQFVFLDLGTPKAKETVNDNENPQEEDTDTAEEKETLKNVYQNIKNQLIADGVPADKIAFIHDAKNDKQKLELVDKFNEGEIRVLIGTTAKLGTGINAQKRAAALHHLDSPWKPRDLEQREGRAIRQGNIVYGPERDANGKIIGPGKGVKIYTYVTERSFDAFMWQAVEAKAKAIKAIMRRSAPPRAVEDVDTLTLSAGEAKALASGNPDVLKQITLKNSINKLQMLKSHHVDSRLRAQENTQRLPKVISELNSDISKMEKDVKLVKDEPKFNIKVNNEAYTERPAAGEAMINAMKGGAYNKQIGEYRGFKVNSINQGPQTGYKLVITNPDTGYEYATTSIPYDELTSAGVIARLDNRIKSIPSDLEKHQSRVKSLNNDLETYQKEVDKKFEFQDQLDKMEKSLDIVNRRLQGEKIEDDSPSDNYIADIEDGQPEYHYGQKTEEPKVIQPEAEIAAVKQEIGPVESVVIEEPTKAEVEKDIKVAEAITETAKPKYLTQEQAEAKTLKQVAELKEEANIRAEKAEEERKIEDVERKKREDERLMREHPERELYHGPPVATVERIDFSKEIAAKEAKPKPQDFKDVVNLIKEAEKTGKYANYDEIEKAVKPEEMNSRDYGAAYIKAHRELEIERSREPLSGYIGFYKGKQAEVFANTKLEAQRELAEKLKAKNYWDVAVEKAVIVSPFTTKDDWPTGTGASVQTGLAGMGKEAAQVEMFGEVSGKTSKKDTLIDADKLKAVEKAKPLAGQINLDAVPPDLPEIKNEPDTAKEKNVIFGALNDTRPNTVIAKDMQTNEPAASKDNWKPNETDLPGWDTTDIKEYQEDFEKVFPGVKKKLDEIVPDSTTGRVKTLESMVKKLKKKNAAGEPFTQNNMEDIIGLRLTLPNNKEIFEAAKKIKGNFEVTQDEDYITKPKSDGYRSYHLTVKHDGKPVEIQLRTPNQTKWADEMHDTFYDHPYEMKEKLGEEGFKKAKEDAKAQAEYYAKIDNGEISAITASNTPTREGQTESRGRHRAEIVGSTPTPATRKARKQKTTTAIQGQLLTTEELKQIQDKRSIRSQAADLNKKHSQIINPSNPKQQQWITDNTSMDIRGIDTPNRGRMKEIKFKRPKPPKSPKQRNGSNRTRVSQRYGPYFVKRGRVSRRPIR